MYKGEEGCPGPTRAVADRRSSMTDTPHTDYILHTVYVNLTGRWTD